MKLIVDEGSYEAPSLFRLVILVLRHRFWHLVHEGRWKD